MKISYSDYVKKLDVSVLVAEAIFSELTEKFPVRKISDIAETSSGGTPLRNIQEYYNGEIPWLKSGELNDGYIENSDECITQQGLQNSSAKLLPEGTLLLAMYGATAGKTGITKIKAATNQAICALFPKDNMNQDFLFWFLKQHRYKFINISKGGAQPNISQAVINNAELPVPDIKTQEQVVKILNGIQAEKNLDVSSLPVEFKEKVVKIFSAKNSVTNIEFEINYQLDLLKKLRQQILQDAVQGKLVPQDSNDEPASVLLDRIKAEKEALIREKKIKKEKPLPAIKPEEVPFEIPEGWVWCKLGEIATLITDGKHGDADSHKNSGYYFLSAKDIQNGKLIYDGSRQITYEDFIETHRRTALEPGDLCVVNTGATIGKTAIALNEEKTKKTTFQKSIAVIKVLQHFTYIQYIEIFIINETPKLLKTSRGSAINNLLLGDLKNVQLPLPPLLEQTRIVANVNQLIALCDELEQTIKQNQEYTRQLLQVALKEALEPHC